MPHIEKLFVHMHKLECVFFLLIPISGTRSLQIIPTTPFKSRTILTLIFQPFRQRCGFEEKEHKVDAEGEDESHVLERVEIPSEEAHELFYVFSKINLEKY
jgi:hypothetical protein